MKGVLLGVGVLAALVGLGWFVTANDLAMTAFFAPRYEQVRRNVFEHSRAFNQGMIQELQNMQFEYERAKDPAIKQSLASIILHRASGYNLEDPDVPNDLRVFIDQLKGQEVAGQ